MRELWPSWGTGSTPGPGSGPAAKLPANQPFPAGHCPGVAWSVAVLRQSGGSCRVTAGTVWQNFCSSVPCSLPFPLSCLSPLVPFSLSSSLPLPASVRPSVLPPALLCSLCPSVPLLSTVFLAAPCPLPSIPFSLALCLFLTRAFLPPLPAHLPPSSRRPSVCLPSLCPAPVPLLPPHHLALSPSLTLRPSVLLLLLLPAPPRLQELGAPGRRPWGLWEARARHGAAAQPCRSWERQGSRETKGGGTAVPGTWTCPERGGEPLKEPDPPQTASLRALRPPATGFFGASELCTFHFGHDLFSSRPTQV